MKNRAWLVLAFLVLLPAVLLAQTPEARIEAARRRAQAAGIPVSLLESKVTEGRAKGVPMDRIAQAVEQRQASLVRAQAAMGRIGAADLSIGADALQAGVTETALRAVIERVQNERRAVAIAALTQLIEMGQAPDQALVRITEALQRGPEALANLPAEVAADRGGRGSRGNNEAASREDRKPAGPPATVPAPGRKPAASPRRERRPDSQ